MPFGESKYEIVGNWTPADQSEHHLEIARTNDDNVRAVRSTFNPNTVLFTTPGQLQNLTQAIGSGAMRSAGLE